MKRHSNKHKAAKAPTKAAPIAAADQQLHHAPVSCGDSVDGQQDAPLLVLHVIRILALYLYVLLSHKQQQDAISLHEIFFAETTTVELLVGSTTATIEQQVHAALLACVRGEMASNQFDGLIQEKTVFTALKRIFRQQKVKATAQCQLLARLLNRYLAQLAHAPIVRCDLMGVLASTLEYLSRSANQPKNEPVSVSLLYPLVNAIDSLSTEQRECLDALMSLWRWIADCDLSETLFDRIVHLHHTVVFHLEPAKAKAGAALPPTEAANLGVCFVRTLVRHADHIFRHDLDFADPRDLLDSDPETEEEDDGSPFPTDAPPTPPPKRSAAPTLSPPKSKFQPAAMKTDAVSLEPVEEPVVIDANEPMPANMMRVGIAAAAGTLAAALCVIFT